MRRLMCGLSLAPLLWFAGCAQGPAPTAADQADASACTAQADAGYDANNVDALSRTSQNGLLFAPDPNRVFDSQRLGSLHARDSQITNCEADGADAGSIAPGTPIVTPHIIGQ